MSLRILPKSKPLPGRKLDLVAPINRGLVAWWPFNEGGGSSVADIGPNGNHGENGDAPKWVGSDTGGGLNFDGGTQHVDCGALKGPAGVISTNTVTFSARVLFHSLTGLAGIMTKRSTSPNSVQGMLLSNRSGNPVSYYWENDGDEWEAFTGLYASLEEWHDVAAVITPTAATVYLDGATWTNTKTHSVKNLTLGSFSIGRDVATREMDGIVSDVRIWNRSLSADEIRQLRESPYG